MNDEYKVIKEFECHGKQMVTVRSGNVAHVMTLEDWHKTYGRNHQDKWETKVDWNIDDLNDEKECISKALEMIASGFQNVIPFQFEKRRKKTEEFDWRYVKEHRVVMK